MFNKRKQRSGNVSGGRQEPRVTDSASQAGGAMQSHSEDQGHGAGAQSASARGDQGGGQMQAAAGPARQPGPRPDPSAVLNRQPTPPVRPDAGRRSAASAAAGRAQAQGQDATEGKKLLVGREISLSGEIRACETLVVEGTVEAEINGTKLLDVQPSGLFKGTATVDVAEIAGRFDGDLTVRERLYVRATGHVHGTIRYRSLEIESGGRIGGTLTELSDADAGTLGQADSGASAAAMDAPAASGAAGVRASNGSGEHGRVNGQGGYGEPSGTDRAASGTGR